MRLSARLSSVIVLSALVASTAVPVAFADNIQYILNTTATIDITTFNDNYEGEYVNVASEPFRFTLPGVCCSATIPLPNASVFVPAGSVITSAFATVTVLQGPYQGTGYIVPAGRFGLTDPSLPSVAPTFSTIGTSEVTVDYFPVTQPAIVNGDEVSSSFQDLSIDYHGNVDSALESPGSNWSGYIAGVGEVDIPYTIELDVTYSPVPEPSMFALLGTGLLGLAGAAQFCGLKSDSQCNGF
jgi:hypothetical protein